MWQIGSYRDCNLGHYRAVKNKEMRNVHHKLNSETSTIRSLIEVESYEREIALQKVEDDNKESAMLPTLNTRL
jgi:hypothetical protein